MMTTLSVWCALVSTVAHWQHMAVYGTHCWVGKTTSVHKDFGDNVCAIQSDASTAHSHRMCIKRSRCPSGNVTTCGQAQSALLCCCATHLCNERCTCKHTHNGTWITLPIRYARAQGSPSNGFSRANAGNRRGGARAKRDWDASGNWMGWSSWFADKKPDGSSRRRDNDTGTTAGSTMSGLTLALAIGAPVALLCICAIGGGVAAWLMVKQRQRNRQQVMLNARGPGKEHKKHKHKDKQAVGYPIQTDAQPRVNSDPMPPPYPNEPPPYPQ